MNMISTLILTLITVVIQHQHIIAQNFTKGEDAIIGTWLMPDDDGIIEVYKEGKVYDGKIIWMKEKEVDGKPLKDKENPDKNLRNRSVEGLQVMTGFKYTGDNVWTYGTFYAALKGKEVEPELVLISNDKLNIEISFILFSKTITLTRVDKNILESLIKKWH